VLSSPVSRPRRYGGRAAAVEGDKQRARVGVTQRSQASPLRFKNW
jgi:hypothetical protein